MIAPAERLMIRLTVNGHVVEREIAARRSLADFLREDLGLTGTHVGCEHGVCGACTVRINGVAQRSCLQPALAAAGQRVQTVEGLANRDGELTDLQAALRRHHALQCGFCTPGILMSAAEFLERAPDPDQAQVREMLSGHLCRCTGYTNIVMAILETAAQRQGRDGA